MNGKAELSKKTPPQIIQKWPGYLHYLHTKVVYKFAVCGKLCTRRCTLHCPPLPPCPRSVANVVKSRSASQYLLWVAPFPFPISFFFSFWFKVNVSRTTSPLDVDSPFPICFLVVNFLCLIYIFFGVLSQGQRDNISNGCRAIWTNSIWDKNFSATFCTHSIWPPKAQISLFWFRNDFNSKKYPKYNIYTCELTMASQVFKRTLVFFYLVYFAELGLRPPIEVPT